MPRRPMRSLQEFCDHLKAMNFVPRTFIDVGACYGTPELFNSFPEAYQILFEPVPELEKRLKLLTSKFPGEYHMIALGDKPGKMTLHVPKAGIEGSTLVPSANSEEIEVTVDTLDHVLSGKTLEKPILLKTDCQGYDLNVIRGGQQLLSDIDLIVMEVNLFHPRNLRQFPDFAEIVCAMKEYGFSVYDIVSYQVRPRDNALGYVDLVFARDDGMLRADHNWGPGNVPGPANASSETSSNKTDISDLTPERLAELVQDALYHAHNNTGIFYPEKRTAGGYVIEVTDNAGALPVPPTHLRHWYGYTDGQYIDELYIESGEADIAAMKIILQEDGFVLGNGPILELGCSAGRLLRHLWEEAKEVECWGVDIHSEAIHWAQGNLSPPFHFCLTTTAPHLPFEDNYFDFLFAGSVFTHIGELDDMWLLELRRVCRKNGRIYITISDKDTLKTISETAPEHPSNEHVADFDKATNVLSKKYIHFVTRTTPWFQRVIYDRELWLRKIDKWFDVRLVRPNSYAWQTGVLLAKK